MGALACSAHHHGVAFPLLLCAAKTGSFKRFHVLVKMLITAMTTQLESEAAGRGATGGSAAGSHSVALDLLTHGDLVSSHCPSPCCQGRGDGDTAPRCLLAVSTLHSSNPLPSLSCRKL